MTGNNTKKIHFLSASDRINYGDLLFPVIFLRVIEGKKLDVSFYNYAVIKNDLTHFGAIPTLSYRKFEKNVAKLGGNVVVGGGEVLFVDWNSMLSYLSYRYSKILKWKFYRSFERKLSLAQYFLSSGYVLVPFAPGTFELKGSGVRIFYNAVGGSFENTKLKSKVQRFKNSLQSATYISVRDERVRDSLKDNNIDSIVCPDSALLLSDLFSRDYLKKRHSFNKIPENYIVLQLGIYNVPKDIHSFNLSILKIAEKLRVGVVLCPIGLAARHEDHIILQKLAKLTNFYQYMVPKSIYDIMFLISNSKMFLGSSLHGVITAQSYSVPFVALNKKQIKVNNYCKTWSSEENCIDFGDEYKILKIFSNWNKNEYQERLEIQKKIVYQNFEKIFSKFI